MLKELEKIMLTENLEKLRTQVTRLQKKAGKDRYLEGELKQIIASQTIERARYYIKRLIKAETQVKVSKINNLNLNRWKEYDDILTDSLWIMEKRDRSGAHSGGYWGNFIPQIPNQLLRRFTKKGEWVLDTFLGSGTTLIESKRLGRNAIGIELQKKVAEMAAGNIGKQKGKNTTHIVNADSASLDYEKELKKRKIDSVQFIVMHPPYWDIIRFSDDPRDLSNAASGKDFIKMMGQIIDRSYEVLDKGRYMAIVIGDKYAQGEWQPIAFQTMQRALDKGYKLKSTIIKNFEDTKGKAGQHELWRYRALVGGFYVFKHEYIFLFQK